MSENSKIEQLKSVLQEGDFLPWHGTWMKTPFRVDGWLCATNGHFVVCIEDADTDAPKAPAEGSSLGTLRGYISTSLSGESFDVGHLKSWSQREQPPCNICHGSGKDKCDDCEGKGKTECFCDCGAIEHLINCDTCAATGKVDCLCHFAIPVSFFGKTVNALLLHRATKLFDGEYQVAGEPDKEKPVILGGKGWKAAIMPMRKEPTETYEPQKVAGAVQG